MFIPNTLQGLLAQIDAIDELLAILTAHNTHGPIWHLSVAPWTMCHLELRRVEIIDMVCGEMGIDEAGRETSLDRVYLNTKACMVSVSVVPAQKTAYRLWDQKGRELVFDRRGWYYVVSDKSGRQTNRRHDLDERSIQRTTIS